MGIERQYWMTRSLILVLSTAVWSSCVHRRVNQESTESQDPVKTETTTQTTDTTGLSEAKTNTEIAEKNGEATAGYHFSMAQAYSAEGNPDRAIEEYKLTLIFDPNSPLVYARLATEYIKKGMMSAAMETCKEALRRDPKFIDARLMLAGLYSTSRETDSAIAEYNRILQQDSANEEAVIYKAQVLMDSGKVGQAQRDLQSFVKKNPESALAWYYIGRVEQRQDHFKESAKAYRKSIELRPGFTQASLSLGYLYEENRMNSDAVTVYRDLYDQSQDLTAANRLATIFLKEEKYKEAIPFLEAVQNSDPDDLNVRVKLGLVQMELKNHSKAVEIFKSILVKNPESDRIHYYLGSLYEETEQFEDAIRELKAIQPDSKLYSDAALHVGYLLKQANRSQEAKSYIVEAIEKSPRVPGFHLFNASLEDESKNTSKAVAILEKALKTFPEDEKILYYLGSLYDRMGQIDKGLERMETLLTVNPKNVDALNYIGYTWTQRGTRLNDAEKLLRQAITLKPNNGFIQDSWGWHLFVRGRISEAIVELEKAAKLKPNESTILDHLGDAYLRSNLREKALQQYENAARAAEDDGSREKIQSKAENLRKELVRGDRVQPAPNDQERLPASE